MGGKGRLMQSFHHQDSKNVLRNEITGFNSLLLLKTFYFPPLEQYNQDIFHWLFSKQGPVNTLPPWFYKHKAGVRNSALT